MSTYLPYHEVKSLCLRVAAMLIHSMGRQTRLMIFPDMSMQTTDLLSTLAVNTTRRASMPTYILIGVMFCKF